jgi:hypothetical protein
MTIQRAGAVVAIALTGAAAQAQTNYLSVYDAGLRYQVANITPGGGAFVRTSGGMGSGGVFPVPDGYPTGFGPCAANDLTFISENNSGMYWSLLQHWWWYRGTGDTREYALSNQTAYQQLGPARVAVTYSEPVASVANALRFDLVYTIDGESAGPDTAYVTVAYTVTNTSNVAQNVALFSHTDLTAGGLSSTNDQWTYTSFPAYSEFRANYSLTQTYPFLTTGALGSVSSQNTRWGSNLTSPTFARTRLSGSSINDANNLNSTSYVSATEGSWNGAIEFQWTLNPGAAVSGTVYVGYNASASWSPCGAADLGKQGGLRGPDGQLDNNDFIVFIDAFFANDAAADVGKQGGIVGPDGLWDNNDFVVFIDLFFAGC